jgi:hypothetical protein
MLASQVTAQTFKILRYFSAVDYSDGLARMASWYCRATHFTARHRWAEVRAGTVFAITTDGSGFTNLHDLRGNDGASPEAGLYLSSNTLWNGRVWRRSQWHSVQSQHRWHRLYHLHTFTPMSLSCLLSKPTATELSRLLV